MLVIILFFVLYLEGSIIVVKTMKGEVYMEHSKIFKLINYNVVYFSFAFLMILVIVNSKNMLDIAYFIVVTYYYIKACVYQKCMKKHHNV